MKNITLNLRLENDHPIYLNIDYLRQYEEELAMFLEDIDYMDTKKFAESVLFNEEIKSNNNIEGINDDLAFIDKVIKNSYENNINNNLRIINLYKGYKYILTHKDINKESLCELYQILSDGLLSSFDKARMGEYYRKGEVTILRGGHYIDESYIRIYEDKFLCGNPYAGVSADKIDYYMNKLLEYINTSGDEISTFLKSQIIHFYFVYIHPYFDVNGRTSRTVAMWYLLNNNSYPYIIFNRAIAFNYKHYEENLIKGKSTGNVTLFLKYMIVSVLIELEKENLIHNIKETSGVVLSKEESEILEYFISTNGNLTIKDLAMIYNKNNVKKKIIDIYEEKIKPLVNKKILIEERDTSSYIYNNIHNKFLVLNKENIGLDSSKTKHLKLTKYINN